MFTKTLTPMLVILVIAALLTLAGEGYAAERAMWVWSMADDIVLNAATKQEFFDFCASPHGDATKAITLVFFAAKPYGVNLMDATNAPALRQFLSDAHDRGIKVEFLSGDKEWATPENRAEGESLIDEITSFNLGGTATQRFDGIQYDVEPYLLKAKENNDPQDWEYDKALVWSEYLALLTNCQTKVNAYNAVNTPDIRFGAAIPRWYSSSSAPAFAQIIDSVDYIALMDYKDTASQIITDAQDEINYADSRAGSMIISGGEKSKGLQESEPQSEPAILFYDTVNEEGQLEGGMLEPDLLNDPMNLLPAAGSVAATGSAVTTLINNGPSANRIDIVFLGDGYTAEEMDKYAADVNKILNGLMEETPFRDYATYLNVHRVDVISNESGVDNYPVGVMYDTALDMGFYVVGGVLTRVLLVNGSKARAEAENAPDSDYIVAVANTFVFGGGGGSISTVAGGNPSSAEITLHELGHTIAGLEDEYFYGEGTWNGSAPAAPNLSIFQADRMIELSTKWHLWLSEPDVDTFEGGLTTRYGIYRPTYNSKMRTLSEPFGPVNSEQLIFKFYEKVTPIDNATPPGTYDLNTVLSVGPLDPPSHALDIQWYLDGAAIQGATGTTLDPSSLGLSQETHTIEVEVTDNTPFVRDESKRLGLMQERRSWIASVESGKKVYIGIETSHPTDTIEFPPSTTFYEEGNTAMETELAQVHSAFSGSSSYAGIAIHYYEDLTGPRGREISYRSLSAGARGYHEPVVSVLSPNRAGEIWYKGIGAGYIQWAASDLDGDAITIKIEYSQDEGITWGIVIGSTSNTGNYLWDTSSLVDGSNYLIRVTATDSSGNVGYDVSNNAVMISSAIVREPITGLHLWNEGSMSLRLKWTPPIYTPRAYRIYRSVNGGIFTEISGSPFVTVNKYIGTGLNGTNKYKYQIKAIYGDGSEGNISNSSNMLIPDGTFLLDYCEENEGITYSGPYGTSALTPSFDTVEKYEGAKSRKLIYAYAGSGWGAILLGALPPVKVDVSPYSTVSIWVKGGVVGQPAFAVKLIETGRPEGSEEWRSPNITISDANWTEYKLNFSDFTLDSAAGNNRLDEHSIGSYGLLFTSTTAKGTYYVDAMQFVSTGATISVPPGPGPNGEYSFGTVNGTISDHRFKIGPIPVSFSGFASPWTIRIWTNNGGGAGKAGLVGVTDANQALRLKVWCANFGPTAAVPDEEDNAYWVNNQTGWFRIPEHSEMNPADVYTWRRLAWANSAQDASLGNPFDIYLAIDVLDAAVIQQYQTTSLTVEYINE